MHLGGGWEGEGGRNAGKRWKKETNEPLIFFISTTLFVWDFQIMQNLNHSRMSNGTLWCQSVPVISDMSHLHNQNTCAMTNIPVISDMFHLHIQNACAMTNINNNSYLQRPNASRNVIPHVMQNTWILECNYFFCKATHKIFF